MDRAIRALERLTRRALARLGKDEAWRQEQLDSARRCAEKPASREWDLNRETDNVPDSEGAHR